MFTFQSFLPVPVLQPYIERYLIVNMKGFLAYEQVLVPSNIQIIGIILKGSIQSTAFDLQSPTISRSYVLGQITCPMNTTYHENLEVFSILFKPAGMFQLFGIPMCKFTDGRIDFELVVSTREKGIIEKIFEPISHQQRVTLIEAFLIKRLAKKSCYLSPQIESASNMILQQNGSISVKQLAYQTNMCERNLERHFIEKVGVPPKTFLGIARMKKVLQMIESIPKLRWQDIIYGLGYTDPAHFIHDFKKYAGKTPTEYYHSTTDFEHFLYGQ